MALELIFQVFTEFNFITTTLIILTIYFLTRKNPKDIPPGPTTWIPFIGNMLEFTEPDMRIPLRRLRRKYGDVYSVYFGSRLAVVLSGYSTIKQAFGKGDTFAHRPSMFLSDTIGEGHGLTTSNGDISKIHRKFTLSAFRELGIGGTEFQERVHVEILNSLRLIHGTHGRPFDLRLKLTVHVANVICSAMFGGLYSYEDKNFQELLENLIECFQLGSAAGAVNFFPFLRFLPGDPVKGKRVLTITEGIKDTIRNIVRPRMASGESHHKLDYTEMFIKQKRETGDPTFTEKQLVLSIADLFGGGTESIATTIQWCLVYMLNYPEEQEKMFREISKKIGKNRLPTISDRRNLKYIEAFIMEIQRSCDIVVFCPPHTVVNDTLFQGHVIPAETVLLPDIPSVHSDPDLWGDPETFRPERFIDEDGNLFKPDYFIPFFIGKRHCVGEAFAKTELFLFLASIVQSFRFEPPKGADVRLEALDGVFGMSHQPKTFEVVAIPREGVSIEEILLS